MIQGVCEIQNIGTSPLLSVLEQKKIFHEFVIF